MSMGMLLLVYMKRRLREASDEELKGFVCHPMHPAVVRLATEEIQRRQKEVEVLEKLLEEVDME